MTKIVISVCYGGFSLSEAAVLRYHQIKGVPVWVEDTKRLGIINYWLVPEEERLVINDAEFYKMPLEERAKYNRILSEQMFDDRDIKRDDPVLLQVVEELGDAASGKYAKLKVVDIPDDVAWEVTAYDGNEQIEEVHRKWA